MKLTFMQWNIRSFPRNKPFLQAAVEEINPQVVCLQETWAKPTTRLTLSGYSVPGRRDRAVGVGGGVSIHISNEIAHTSFPLPAGLEATAAQVHLPSHTVTICSVYLPPNSALENMATSLADLSAALPHPFLICADLNAHHQSWGSPYSDRRGRIVAEWLQQSSLALVNTGEPTRMGPQGNFTHIDLTISSTAFAPTMSWNVHPHPFHSDHFPITIKTGLPITPASSPRRWVFSRADWKKFRASLTLPTEFLSPSAACSAVEGRIKAAASESIPQTTGGRRRRQTHCWWTPGCKKAHR